MIYMAKNSRAASVIFGFDFQVNAAIVLMLEHIEELKSLKLEGNYEDIELTLSNNEYILAQAKSAVNGSTDFRNVRKNLKKALETLSEGASKVNTRQVVLITNSFNPLKEEASYRLFNNGLPSYRKFSSLPDSSQKIISDYLKKIEEPLDINKFLIQVLPFETDIDKERYKFVQKEVDEFIGKLNLNNSILGNAVLTIWFDDVFRNASKKNVAIVLDKKSIIWPLIIKVTDIDRCDNEFLEEFDEALYDEIVYQYKELINSCCEKFDFFSKVLYDYKLFQSKKKMREKCLDFSLTKWKDYLDDLKLTDVEEEVQKGFIQIVLYRIVRNRIQINKIKNGVNL